MTPNDLAQLSPEEFVDFVISHFEDQGYALEKCLPAPVQLLLFRLDEALHVVDCLPNPPLMDQIWDVTSVEVAWCASTAKVLTAACGYVITRSRFAFGTEEEAICAGRKLCWRTGRCLN